MAEENGRTRRRGLIIGVSVLLVVAVAGGLTFMARRANGNGEKKDDKEATPPAPVELSTVQHGAIATYLQATTTLEARHEATLIARRQGQILRLAVEEGAWVEKGASLAVLDDREARLAVERTELAAKMADRELERANQLGKQGYLSPKQVDDLEVARRNAAVALEQARYDLSLTRVTAPFSGRVIDRMVKLGETVSEGKACFRIADFDPILARVYFPERELARVRVGQEAAIVLDADPGRAFPAKVTLVNPAVDPTNGTFKVTLEVRNHSGALRPGAFARVRLQTGAFQNAVLLPRRGILSEDGDDYVYVARGDSVVRVPVRVGAVENDTAQILGGLTTGDRVVTVGHGGLKPGSKIKPVTL
jgi:membrane fusion protein (multidrug efflux system)